MREGNEAERGGENPEEQSSGMVQSNRILMRGGLYLCGGSAVREDGKRKPGVGEKGEAARRASRPRSGRLWAAEGRHGGGTPTALRAARLRHRVAQLTKVWPPGVPLMQKSAEIRGKMQTKA